MLDHLHSFRQRPCQNAFMRVQVTIRDIPTSVRDVLAARAALRGLSMQEFLRGELERIAAKPPIDEVIASIRERKATTTSRIGAREILQHRDADRR